MLGPGGLPDDLRVCYAQVPVKGKGTRQKFNGVGNR